MIFLSVLVPSILFLTLDLGRVGAVKLEDYCKPDSGNTPCSTECIRSQSCGVTSDGFVSFTDAERNTVLKKHNDLRQAVAKGDFADHKLPACDGGISVLSYDKEMEFLAACHIKACDFNHDKVRLNSAGKKCGQNLHYTKLSSASGFPAKFLEDGIQNWFDEYKKLKGESQITTYSSGGGIGHLTALLWGKTTLVGCAKMHYVQSNMHYYSLFCDYYEKPNWIGEPVYKAGACTKNTEFPDLCGTIRPIADDKFISPLDLNAGFTIGVWSLLVYLIWNIIFVVL